METTSLNITLQYVIVGIILTGVAIWIIRKIIFIHKHGSKSCCGCSLSETCVKKNDLKRKAGECCQMRRSDAIQSEECCKPTVQTDKACESCGNTDHSKQRNNENNEDME